MSFRKYLLSLLIVCLSVGVVGAVIFLTVLKQYYLPVFPWILAFMAAITLAEHYIMTKSLSGRPNRFSQSFMGVSAAKLFLILIVMVIYLLVRKEDVISFVAVIFVLYVIFTWFEVRVLLKLVKEKHDN